MMLTELTTVPPSALPVDGFKTHLRLGSGFADDGLQDEVLDSYLRAAIAAIEARTGKILIERGFAWTLTAWRDADRQPLPLAPVNAIGQVVLIPSSGPEVVIDPQRYVLEKDDQRPSIIGRGGALPTLSGGSRIRIEMLAGYSADWDLIPADLRQAVFMLASYFYEFRNETTTQGVKMPFGVAALIERYRTVRLFMGGGQ